MVDWAGDGGDDAVGVLFGLGFLIVRWISLIDNLLWSGLILIAASAGLFAVARAWRHSRPSASWTRVAAARRPFFSAAASPAAKWLGLLGVVLASVNIFGGFAVTQRMLSLYKKKERSDA